LTIPKLLHAVAVHDSQQRIGVGNQLPQLVKVGAMLPAEQPFCPLVQHVQWVDVGMDVDNCIVDSHVVLFLERET